MIDCSEFGLEDPHVGTYFQALGVAELQALQAEGGGGQGEGNGVVVIEIRGDLVM